MLNNLDIHTKKNMNRRVLDSSLPTMNDRELKMNVGHILKAGRHSCSLSQMELSTALDMNQSVLSRLESGDLTLGAAEWMAFCEITGISPHSLTLGYIDRNRNATLQPRWNSAFQVPARYSDDRGTNVRAIVPFLSFLRTKLGYLHFSQFLSDLGVDPAFFVDYDNRINMNFCLDLLGSMAEHGYLTDSCLEEIAHLNRNPNIHGLVHHAYDKAANPLEVIKTFVQRHRKYSCDYSIKMFWESKEEVTVSMTPNPYLSKYEGVRGDAIPSKICSYITLFLNELAHYRHNRPIDVLETSCRHKEKECVRCLYRIRLVG